jgi:hypothetical protein
MLNIFFTFLSDKKIQIKAGTEKSIPLNYYALRKFNSFTKKTYINVIPAKAGIQYQKIINNLTLKFQSNKFLLNKNSGFSMPKGGALNLILLTTPVAWIPDYRIRE